jgi:hypothetical protein
MSTPKLYLFSIAAIDATTRTNYIEPTLIIDVTPQSAAKNGLEIMEQKRPGCTYQVGVVYEVPQNIIDDIKRLL